jgi:hypothetical protein
MDEHGAMGLQPAADQLPPQPGDARFVVAGMIGSPNSTDAASTSAFTPAPQIRTAAAEAYRHLTRRA